MTDSHQAFTNVDEMVAKPVFGSDGALAWQEFKATNKQARKGGSVAPNLPMKRSDRLGTGLKSIQEERALENEIRKKSGKVAVGEGYTEFKRRGNDQEEAALKKKKKMIESRIRPDDVPYFIPTPIFKGWKKDYVFTTRDSYGTGYYWDGMDSARESLGLPVHWLVEPPEGDDNNEAHDVSHKRKKKRSINTTNEVSTSNNPLEQVMNAIARVNNLTTINSTTIVPGGNEQPNYTDGSNNSLAMSSGWVTAQDPSSGKTYFYHTQTKETRWDCPIASAGKTVEALPSGWSIARDKSGKEYYYHMNGQTTWDRPSI